MEKQLQIAKTLKIDNLTVEQMVCRKYTGLLCKICESDYFGVLFRLANTTNKTKYGCHRCIVTILESMISSKSSDDNKKVQDFINEITPDIYKK